MTKNSKLLMGVAVVIVVVVAAILAYTLLQDNEGGEKETVLTVLYGGDTWEYTMNDLKNIDEFSGSGGMSSKSGIKDPNDFTGVRFELLLQDIGVTNINTVEAKFIAADGYNKTFDSDVIMGNVTIYDATGNETNGTVTLSIAYEQDDEPISADDGSLRSVFVSEQPLFTSSSYWIKQLTTIEVSSAT
jgi:hypothetical protein